MENIKTGCIPIGQVVRREYRGINIGKFIKDNKIALLIAFISLALLSTYTILIMNFINLIKILN